VLSFLIDQNMVDAVFVFKWISGHAFSPVTRF
jgi:hypothetical protein